MFLNCVANGLNNLNPTICFAVKQGACNATSLVSLQQNLSSKNAASIPDLFVGIDFILSHWWHRAFFFRP